MQHWQNPCTVCGMHTTLKRVRHSPGADAPRPIQWAPTPLTSPGLQTIAALAKPLCGMRCAQLSNKRGIRRGTDASRPHLPRANAIGLAWASNERDGGRAPVRYAVHATFKQARHSPGTDASRPHPPRANAIGLAWTSNEHSILWNPSTRHGFTRRGQRPLAHPPGANATGLAPRLK